MPVFYARSTKVRLRIASPDEPRRSQTTPLDDGSSSAGSHTVVPSPPQYLSEDALVPEGSCSLSFLGTHKEIPFYMVRAGKELFYPLENENENGNETDESTLESRKIEVADEMMGVTFGSVEFSDDDDDMDMSMEVDRVEDEQGDVNIAVPQAMLVQEVSPPESSSMWSNMSPPSSSSTLVAGPSNFTSPLGLPAGGNTGFVTDKTLSNMASSVAVGLGQTLVTNVDASLPVMEPLEVLAPGQTPGASVDTPQQFLASSPALSQGQMPFTNFNTSMPGMVSSSAFGRGQTPFTNVDTSLPAVDPARTLSRGETPLANVDTPRPGTASQHTLTPGDSLQAQLKIPQSIIASQPILAPTELTLEIELSKESFVSYVPNSATVDLQVVVYYNGQLEDRRMISSRLAAGTPSRDALLLTFPGDRVASKMERRWVVVPHGGEKMNGAGAAQMSAGNISSAAGDLFAAPGNTPDDANGGGNSVSGLREHWISLGEALQEEAELWGRNQYGEHSVVGNYLSSLANLDMPVRMEGMVTSNGKMYGVIDVVILLGDGQKHSSSQGYLKEPMQDEEGETDDNKNVNKNVNVVGRALARKAPRKAPVPATPERTHAIKAPRKAPVLVTPELSDATRSSMPRATARKSPRKAPVPAMVKLSDATRSSVPRATARKSPRKAPVPAVVKLSDATRSSMPRATARKAPRKAPVPATPEQSDAIRNSMPSPPASGSIITPTGSLFTDRAETSRTGLERRAPTAPPNTPGATQGMTPGYGIRYDFSATEGVIDPRYRFESASPAMSFSTQSPQQQHLQSNRKVLGRSSQDSVLGYAIDDKPRSAERGSDFVVREVLMAVRFVVG
ncbi:MAG: hypothetical protein M1823_003096 [Watsoniomyces obsoletus]|nr:MAG: hypothetical protein M1823_003096 [Watsoniomyces obsoletus]